MQINLEKEKMIQAMIRRFVKRIGKVILTRQRDGCDKDRTSVIDDSKRKGENNNEDVRRQGKECTKEKEKRSRKGDAN